jgi:hypothetical protein
MFRYIYTHIRFSRIFRSASLAYIINQLYKYQNTPAERSPIGTDYIPLNVAKFSTVF